MTTDSLGTAASTHGVIESQCGLVHVSLCEHVALLRLVSLTICVLMQPQTLTTRRRKSHLQVQVVQILLKLQVGVVSLGGDTVEVI